MAAAAREIDEGLGHERGAKPVLLGNGLHHEFEEGELIGRGQRVVEIPVDLKLAVGIFMIVLIRAPTQLHHGGGNLGDHINPAHDRRLVIAGLFLHIAPVGNL